MMKKLFAFALVAAFAFVLVALSGCVDKTPVGGPSIEGRPFVGGANATVTIVEFSDFECPICGRFYSIIKQVETQYGDKVKFVYKHFPLRDAHPYAQKAAEASECANDQGKFYAYHDVLFQNQNALDVPSLKQYARDLGLNGDVFDACLDAGTKVKVVNADYQEGSALGISGTPTFYVNNVQYVGYTSFERLKAIIDAELAKKGASS
jgi:protein-disulfide isomerase